MYIVLQWWGFGRSSVRAFLRGLNLIELSLRLSPFTLSNSFYSHVIANRVQSWGVKLVGGQMADGPSRLM